MATLTVMFMSMVVDGLNSTMAEINVLHLYTPTNPLRLVTGLLSGIALAPLLVWLLSLVGAPPTGRRLRAVLRSPWELVTLLGVSGAFAALVVDGRAALYYPVALISVAGVVSMMAGMLMLVIMLMAGLDGRVTRARQVVMPGAVGLLLTFAILAATAALRWTGMGSL